MAERGRSSNNSSKAWNRGGRDADYRRGLTYATTDGCDVERRDRRGLRIQADSFLSRHFERHWLRLRELGSPHPLALSTSCCRKHSGSRRYSRDPECPARTPALRVRAA